MGLSMRNALGVGLLVTILVACGGGGSDNPPNGNGNGVPSNVPAASFTFALNYLNQVRTGHPTGSPPLMRDANIDAFAMAATQDFMNTGVAHGYFIANNPGCSAPGFGSACAENQGWASGSDTVDDKIRRIIDGMMAEESMYPPGHPDRGHFETIVDPTYSRVGIGLMLSGTGALYLTNDFSN